MALFHSPSTVVDGLVLCLDAGNTRSYPGSGTTWTDLSGNGRNGALSGGPTYSSSNGGFLGFDGTNDYADIVAGSLSSIASVEMWCNISNVTEKFLFGWSKYGVYCRTGNLGFNTYNSDVYGISDSDVSSLLLNKWAHFVFEMRSDVSYVNNKMYINGNLQNLSQQDIGSEFAANRTFNLGNGRIAASGFENLYNMSVKCGCFRVYNRALTAAEIRQNYNATKGRYGL
jgi:hypothetical protein